MSELMFYFKSSVYADCDSGTFDSNYDMFFGRKVLLVDTGKSSLRRCFHPGRTLQSH